MRFSEYFDCIVNEKKCCFFSYRIMISAAHMLEGMLPCEKFFLKMCNLIHLGEYFDQILYQNCFFKVTSIEQNMLMGFKGIFPMNKHEI